MVAFAQLAPVGRGCPDTVAVDFGTVGQVETDTEPADFETAVAADSRLAVAAVPLSVVPDQDLVQPMEVVIHSSLPVVACLELTASTMVVQHRQFVQ